jgi:hypothetical protein
MGQVRFTVLADGRMRQMATCEMCGAVLTPAEDELLIDALEQHSQWHYAMQATAEEIKTELREQGFKL